MALLPQRSSTVLVQLSLGFLALATAYGCGGSSSPQGLDTNGDGVIDDVGTLVDENGDQKPDLIDLDKNGKFDGPAIDTNGDGKGDAFGLDTDCDGFYESIDVNGDGRADYTSRRAPPQVVANCPPLMLGSGGSSSGSGGAGGSGGSGPVGGSGGGSSGSGGSGTVEPSQLGKGTYQGSGKSSERYAEDDLYRNTVGYKFIANGWGKNWQSHDLTWNGTSFTVASLKGTAGDDYSPAGYPTVFCGQYSNPPKQSAGKCGLPAAVSSLTSLRTGWRWKANGNTGQYNAAWDIWLGNGGSLSSYLMVWLRDPPGQQPAGRAGPAGITVDGLPGKWDLWTGTVSTPAGSHPIVNYIRTEGQDLAELEFDVLAVYKDAKQRGYDLPGTNILSVAVGFEVWNGPVTNLVSEDFYVDAR